MARPVSTSLHDQTASLRQLKLLVIILVLSNIGLGVFSFYLLREVDRKYTNLISRSVHVLNDLQTLTAYSVEAMRGTNASLFEVPVDQRKDVIERARSGLEKEKALREQLLQDNWLKPDEKERIDFQKAGTAFGLSAGGVVAAFADDRLAEANRLREQSLRPAFERYVAATTKVADKLQDESLRVSNELTANTGSVSTIMLGLASWPVVILGALLLLTAVFVIVLMVLFRGREMSDMP